MNRIYFLLLSVLLILGCTIQYYSDNDEIIDNFSLNNNTLINESSGNDNYVNITTYGDNGSAGNITISGNEYFGFVNWDFFDEWKADTVPPECGDIILETPVNISLATSVLYPGQMRGGYYKAHGGLRFDYSNDNDIIVTAPFDGYVIRGSRYIESNEVQYLFDILNPCGIMYRFDHLRVLSEKFAEIAAGFPEAVEGDTRTSDAGNVFVESGEVVAISVGLDDNVFFDFGVYDLRQRNEASNDADWLAEHNGWSEPYALCWLELLSANDSESLRLLPGADYNSGTESDYCN